MEFYACGYATVLHGVLGKTDRTSPGGLHCGGAWATLADPKAMSSARLLGWNGRFERVITPDVDDFRRRQAVAGDPHAPRDSGRNAILHGDYRIDNVILDIDDPCNILAVLDWEICALGDPLMDLGSSLAYWMQDDDPVGLQACQCSHRALRA